MRSLALAAALLAASPAVADDFDEEFERAPAPSIALGPVTRGGAMGSADVGWLRSGVRADLGLTPTLDLVARADAFALGNGLRTQNAVYVGLRWSPLGEVGPVRVSLTGEGGSILHSSQVRFALRGELAVGALFALATPYARAALRGLLYDAGRGEEIERDGELALGVERRLGRFIVGAEGSLWTRRGLENLPQWRLRGAYSF